MKRSIILIPKKGIITPPIPNIVKNLRTNRVVFIGLYLTPVSAIGIHKTIIKALNILADIMAL